jgi:DNA-binding transcriptional LysR family regulator
MQNNNANALRKLDVQDFLVFASVYEQRNLTLACDALHLNPSVANHCLKKLRMHFQDELFICTRNGMRPTRKATAMRSHVQSILHHIESCESGLSMFDPVQRQTMFTVYAPEYFELLVLPHLMRNFIGSGFDVTVEVRTLEKQLPVGGLRDDYLDLALCFGPDFQDIPSGLSSQVLLEDDLVCVMDRESASHKPAIDVATFVSRPHVYPVPWTSDTNLVDTWLQKHGQERQVVARANSYAAALQMLPGTDLILTLPRRIQTLLGNEPWLAVCELPVDLPGFTLDMVWSEHADSDDANGWFREQVIKVCAEQGLI